MPPLKRGGVYLVADEAINFPPDYVRDPHKQRTAIIVSGDAVNQDSSWEYVLVVPTSSQSQRKTSYCLQLGYGVANLDKKCWARVACVQPIAKTHVRDYKGDLPDEMLNVQMKKIIK